MEAWNPALTARERSTKKTSVWIDDKYARKPRFEDGWPQSTDKGCFEGGSPQTTDKKVEYTNHAKTGEPFAVQSQSLGGPLSETTR